MKRITKSTILVGMIALGGCSSSSTAPATTGPNGGDLVPIKGGSAYAELLANADTGEVMVHTWDKDKKTRRPIERDPITIGNGDKSVQLTPHPMDSDPSGTSSRFYAHADWMRGGDMKNGWMEGGGMGGRHTFDWNNCWQGGRAHGTMWEEMGKHRRMGPGHHGGGMER